VDRKRKRLIGTLRASGSGSFVDRVSSSCSSILRVPRFHRHVRRSRKDGNPGKNDAALGFWQSFFVRHVSSGWLVKEIRGGSLSSVILVIISVDSVDEILCEEGERPARVQGYLGVLGVVCVCLIGCLRFTRSVCFGQ
jgi:hypothetical protein